MRRILTATLLGLLCVAVCVGAEDTPPTSTVACPIAATPDPDHQLSFGKIPPSLQPGTPIDAQISPALTTEKITAACFDQLPLAPPAVKSGGSFTLSVPTASAAAPDQPWPPGSHTISLLVNGKSIQQSLRNKVRLDSVFAVPLEPGDNTLHVVFSGEGFNVAQPASNAVEAVLPGGTAHTQNVCWSDADCNAKNSNVRGEVRNSKEIVVSNLSPSDERNYRFRVCVAGECTLAVSDTSTRYLWTAPGVALVLAVLLAGVVILLAWQLRPVVIGGEKYLLSVLFLDKETNTFSLSKLQFYVWSFVATFGYIELVISKNFFQHVGGLPSVPAGLPGIVGIAAGTAIGAQVVTNINGPKGAGQLKPSLADFVTSGDTVAAERVQFFVWTLIGALSFFVIVCVADPRAMTDLPAVPMSLLSISGLSAFGYLGGKLARKGGPVIVEIMARKGPDPAAPGTTIFGIIEIRGRSLSRDANFRISRAADTQADDLDISFDLLNPDPNDPKMKKPRLVELDPDANDPTVGKRLLLVIDIADQKLANVFVDKSVHTLTIANPDSQKAMLQFTVPESQKAD